MFSTQQLIDAQAKVKSGRDFPQFASELKNMGISSFDYEVSSGIQVFHIEEDRQVKVNSQAELIEVATEISKDKLKSALQLHQQGKTDLSLFRHQAAEAGVARWSCDLESMEVVYISQLEKVMMAESIQVK